MRTQIFAVGGLLVLSLAACGGDEQAPEVTPAPVVSEEPAEREEEAATQEVAPEPEESAPTAGTREAPLALGEARKLSSASAWTVSAITSDLDAADAITAADEYAPTPADGETFVLGTFSIAVDGDAIAAQGMDLANDGADPWMSVWFEYVAADGTSFDGTSGTGCYTDDMLHSQGSVYDDGAVVTGDICVAVPTDKVPGGLWRVSNNVNDSVWIASS